MVSDKLYVSMFPTFFAKNFCKTTQSNVNLLSFIIEIFEDVTRMGWT